MDIVLDTRKLIVQWEVFRRTMNVTGSIVECGVGKGVTFLAWAQLHGSLDRGNCSRRLIGFDTFSGFPHVAKQDQSKYHKPKPGDIAFDTEPKVICDIASSFFAEQYLREGPRVELIAGDILKTVPQYVTDNRHTVVSILHIDVDLYEPTLCALQHFVPRMPKGAIVLFDEINMQQWPGEVEAMLEYFGPHPKLETLSCHSAAAILTI